MRRPGRGGEEKISKVRYTREDNSGARGLGTFVLTFALRPDCRSRAGHREAMGGKVPGRIERYGARMEIGYQGQQGDGGDCDLRWRKNC